MGSKCILMLTCSKKGYELMNRLKKYIIDTGICKADDIICKVKCAALDEISDSASVEELTGRYFDNVSAIIFIAATGIAVRSIAPYIGHKSYDPAVIVIDVAANYCIPILSGHAGGANELAEKLSLGINAEAVITTATDVCGAFAVDEFARKNNLVVTDWTIAKKISAELINGEKTSYSVEISDRASRTDEKILKLIPRDIVVGIGCRRETASDKIRDAVYKCLSENDIDVRAVCSVSSIDLKKNEEGIIALSDELNIPFITYSETELKTLSGEYSASDFVRNVTGIDCVCERSAVMCAGGDRDSLVCNKTVYDGVTVALARREINIEDEEIICSWNRSGSSR